ncbi:Protein of unknown function, partial [Cotesia congregata]
KTIFCPGIFCRGIKTLDTFGERRVLNLKSNHPLSQKLGVAQGFFNRAIRLSHVNMVAVSTGKVKHLLMNNNYPSSLLRKCEKITNDRINSNLRIEAGLKGWSFCKLPYIKGLSPRIGCLFRQTNCKLFDAAHILDYESHFLKRNISEMFFIKVFDCVNFRSDTQGLSSSYRRIKSSPLEKKTVPLPMHSVAGGEFGGTEEELVDVPVAGFVGLAEIPLRWCGEHWAPRGCSRSRASSTRLQSVLSPWRTTENLRLSGEPAPSLGAGCLATAAAVAVYFLISDASASCARCYCCWSWGSPALWVQCLWVLMIFRVLMMTVMLLACRRFRRYNRCLVPSERCATSGTAGKHQTCLLKLTLLTESN